MKRSLYLALFSLILSVGALSAVNAHTVSTSLFTPDGVSGSAAIQTQPLSSATFCLGSRIVVQFTTSGTGFDGSTSYSVELSDASGSFASPTVLPQVPVPPGILQNNTYIYVQIPATVAPGSGYRIRVVSASPSIVGTDNGEDLTITDLNSLTAPAITVNGAQQFCFGSATTYVVSSVTNGNLWFPGGTNTNPFVGVVLSGNYYTQITSPSGCATNSPAASIQVNPPVFGFLGYFENGLLASTSDTTVNICSGDSLEIGVLIEGGSPPFDLVYTSDGFNFEFVNDVGVPYAENTFVYTTFVSDPGIYQLLAVTDAFVPPCNSQGTTGTVIVQQVPPPVTSFSYEPFCGSESGVPVAATDFLGGGVYSFDTAPTDGATVNASSGVISGAVIGNTYVVRYTVSEGLCTDISSTTSITVSSSDVVAFTINPFCEGSDSNFPVTASGFEGGGTYSFNPAVSDGASINPVTGIISGAAGATTYTVQYVSPSGVCQASASTSVTTLDAPEISFSVVNSTCGNEIGSVDATVTEGISPYSFSWSNGSTTEDVSGLEASAYTLTVTDAQSCTVQSTASVINENQPELVLNTINATCGSNNGSINLTINNGVGPYTIIWSPGGQTTEDIANLSAGTYTVTVTDATTSCELTGSAAILFQGAPTATFISENSLCGQAIGSIDITVTGGTLPITHNWSNGASTEDITGLAAGAYTDTITDANGCFTIVSVNILNENLFTLSSSVVNPTCGNPNGGSIDLTVGGGDAPFTFEWSPNSTSVTEDVSGLASGSYTVVVTDNAGCVDSLISTLAPVLPIELVGIASDATCGNADGGINLTVSGGSGSYNFLWDNGTLTEDLSNIEAGTYSVVVIDQIDANCTANASYAVVNGNQPEVTVLSSNSSCTGNTGAISLTLTGGSGNFSFSWTGPDGFASSSEDLTGLADGSYSVVITDNSTTCVVNETAVITLENAPTYTSNVIQTSCGQSNGIIDIEVAGGTLPFTITWNGNISSLDQINLAAGTYAFLLTDANNCQVSETFTIAPSVAPSLSSDFSNPSCGNDTGRVDITVTNAADPIVYSWTKDGAPFAGSEDISALSAGTYIVLATDAAGCAVTDTFTLINSNQATLSFTSNPTLCSTSTGSINLTVNGGTAPFNFAWTGPDGFTASTEDLAGLAGGCYSVTVTDASTCVVSLQACVLNSNAPVVTFNAIQPSCNNDNGSIAPIVSGGIPPYSFAWSGTVFAVDSTIDNLGTGNYVLTVTDASGCETIDSVALNNSGVPNVTGNVDDPECGINDGSITTLVSGGLAPYTYLWSPGGSTGSTLSNLGVGEYSVLVTDAAGCESTGLFSLANLNAPEIASTITNTECGESGGAINITVSGGSGDYSFAWTGSGVNANSEDQSNLSAGAYSVLVTDNTSGCETTSTIEVENSNLPLLTLISVGTLCGANSGSVALTVTNALNPTFSWTGPNGFTATTEDISNLSTGIYSVTVTDGACVATGSVSVSPTKSVWSQNVTLVAGSQYNFQVFAQNVVASSPAQLRVFVGSANLGAFTPTGNVTWTQFVASFTATTSGLTEVKIVNENLSPNGNDFGIDDISLVQVCPAIPPPGSTCGTNIIVNGGFESGNTGFLSQYTFVPNGPANNELIPEGTYGIAANANTMHPQFQGTGRSGNFMIVNGNEPENPVLSFSTVGATCSTNNGSVNLTVTNFTIPISYAWSGPNGFVASSQDISGLAAGLYTVSVTSGACTQTGSATVGFTNLPTLALNATPASCGNSDASINLTITGATNPTIEWTGPSGFTASTEDISNLAEGLYNVTVTSGNCVVEDSIAVIVDQPQLAFSILPSSCSGSDGSIDLTVTNSNSPSFSWSGPNGFTATTEDISGLSAGEYFVTVTDGECVVEGSAAINSTAPVITFNTIQPSCNNDNGSIAPIISGGQAPFTFAWSGNLISSDSLLENLGSGTYDLAVIDANGCEAEGSVTLNNTGVPSIVGTPTNPDCGIDNGSISASISGGSLPYSILWSPGGSTESTIANLGVGTYTIQVTDASGCETTSEFTLTNSNAPEITSVASNSTCGETSGAIDITVSNGSGNYTYVWSGNGVVTNTEDQSGLGAGSYTVLVTDNSTGCEATTTVEIINGDAPLLTLISIGTLCGDNSGSINMTVTNAVNPTFSWTGPNGFTATTEDISGLSTGVYTVTVTDGDCEATASATVSATKSVWSQNVNLVAGSQYNFQMFAQNVFPTAPAQLRIYVGDNTLGSFAPAGSAVWTEFSASFTATVSGLTEVKIVNESLISSGNDFGLDDISLIEVCPAIPVPGSTCGTNIIVNGGFESGNTGFLSQYTFVANGPSNNELIPAGTYSVAPNAAQLHPQFTGTGRSGNFMVVNGNIPVNPVLSFATVGASCSANNGSINLSVANLTNPVSYAWTGPNGFTASTQDINNLAGGTYNVIVTSGGCTQSGSATVTFTNLPVLASVVTPAGCQLSNGSIDLSVTNVTSPTIAWSGPDGFTATTEDIANLAEGSYIVTVTQGTCVVSDTIEVISDEPILDFVTQPSSCSGSTGSIDLTVSNANSPTFSWSGPDGFTATTQDINGLAAGEYILIVTDGDCVVEDTVTIDSDIPDVTATATQASCGSSDGSIDLTIGDGPTPTFSWTGPNGFTSTDEDISGLAIGCYTVVVTFTETCQETREACVTNDNAPTIAFTAVQPSCGVNNGSITPVISGGQAPFTFEWSGTQFAVDSVFENLGSGSYVLSVTGANGCVSVDSIALNATGIPTVSGIISNPDCGLTNGSITAEVTGGLAPYTYLWTPGGSTSPTISTLGVGSYSVLVTDASGCEATSQFELENIGGPQIAVSTTGSQCGEGSGSIDITVTDGSGNYIFEWTGTGVNPSVEDQTGLTSGSYTVLVTDNESGCEATATVEIENSNQPTLSLVSVGTLCGANSGFIDLTVTNAVNPTFSWTGPDGFTATTEDIEGLSIGEYTVTVTDGNCEVTASATVSATKAVWTQNVTLNAGSQYDFQMFAQNVFAQAPAQLRVYVGGNTIGSFTPVGLASWTEFTSSFTASVSGTVEIKVVNESLISFGNDFGIDDISLIEVCPSSPPPGSTCGTNIIVNGDFENGNTGFTSQYDFAPNGPANNELIPAGLYSIAPNAAQVHPQFTGTGRSGSFMIINGDLPADPTLSFTTLGASCNADNGSINLSITDFTLPITYAWTGPDGFTASTQDISGLTAGTYTVNVVSGGCNETGSATVTFTDLPVLTLDVTPADCGQSNAAVNLSATNTTNPTYAWTGPNDFTATTEDINNLAEGSYSVTLTEGSCVVEETITINTDEPQLDLTVTPTGCGGPTGSIDLLVTNANSPTFSWSGPDGFTATTEDITGLGAGEYSVIVTDGACVVEDTVIIDANDPELTFATTTTTCGASEGSVDLTLTNSNAPSFSWTGPNGFTATTEDISGLAGGSYVVTVTEGTCQVVDSVTIVNSDGPTASIAASTETVCPGEDVELTITFTGTAPFTFTYTDGTTPVTISGYDADQYVITVNPTSLVTYTLTDLISDANPDCEGSFTTASVTISISSSPTAPTITAGGDTEFCQGGSVVLTSSEEIGNVWNISGPEQFSQSITVTEEGSYFVTVINEFGCIDTSNIIDVDVLPTGVEVAFSDTTVCAGTSIQLVANGGDTYLWSPSVYLSTILSGTTTCTPFETTTYVVTSTNACGTGSDTVTVAVNPIATTNLGSDLTLCQNTPLTLSVPFQEGVSYSWGPAGAILGQADSSSAAINTFVSTEVFLQTTNTNGCVFTDTVSIDIEVPLATFNISAEGPTTFCQGDSLVLQATTGNLVSWSNGLENFDAILVTESGDYYAVYNGSNCPVYSDTISVTVTPLPSVSIVPEGALTVCEGTCVSLLASDTSGILWTLANGTSSTETSINACDNGWYVLSRTVDACSASDSVFVTVLPQIAEPVITLDGSDVICEGQSTSTLISSYATGNQWLLNGQPIQGATSNTLVISVGGLYSVQVNSAAGCSDTSATIEILQKSTDPIEITAADTVVCNDEQINILLTATPGFVSYTWFGNGESGESYTATYLGEYAVVGVNEDGCQSTDYITVVGNVPFEVDAVSPVLYDDFNVTYAGAEDGSINVDVTGGSGIFTYSWSNGSTAEDLTGLSGGDYTLTVTDDQGCTIVSTVTVKEPGLVQLPNGFTPNGDAFNDFYVIRGIQGYEGNQINVFNRWGSLVYSAKDYQNNWDGTSNDGNLLPDGTYFIVVNLNKEGFDDVKSYIDLRRN